MARSSRKAPGTVRRAKANGRAVVSRRPRKKLQEAKPISLALQGGGAHGAFTWGVLDRLLEDERVVIEGISGTSAGAMNGAVLVQGYATGGREGAREALDRFWSRISEAGRTSPIQRTPLDRLMGTWSMDWSPSYLSLDLMSRLLSPYQLNPGNHNPLRDILEEQIDFELLRPCSAIKLFVSATNVRTGKVRVFGCGELSVDALLASACLPFMFQAIEIDGEPYWDGGYMGNPALFPLIYNCLNNDIVIVQINPLTRDEVPRTAAEILNRVNEISFNSTLNREIRAIAFVRKLIDAENLSREKYRRLNLHMIESEDCMKGLGVSSKLNAEWEFLTHLKAIGQAAADDWLGRNFDRIGVETTVDLEAKFL